MTQYIVVLCCDCGEVPLDANPKFGDAKAWQGMLICETCGAKRRAESTKGSNTSQVVSKAVLRRKERKAWRALKGLDVSKAVLRRKERKAWRALKGLEKFLKRLERESP